MTAGFQKATLPRAPKFSRWHPVPFETRFWSKIVVRGEGELCWPWLAAIQSGYGYIRQNGRPRLAHRVAYEHLVGPIPEGLDIDHLCRNRRCCNPLHMEPVTRSENVKRGHMARAKERAAA